MTTQRPASPISRTPSPQPSPQAKSQESPREGLSPKARQSIAIGALIACLLIGAGIVYWFLIGASPKHRTVTVDPKEQGGGMNMRQGNFQQAIRRPPQAITKEDDSTWRVNTNAGVMTVKTQPGGGYGIALHHEPRGFLTPPQAALVSGVVRARTDQAMATEWGITPDQVTQLKNLRPGGFAMAVTEPERGEMQQLWKTYIGASDGTAKTDAEKALIKRLDELAKAHLDDSRKLFMTRLDEVKKILTPEQVDKLSK